MDATKQEKDLYGAAVQIVDRTSDKVVYRVANETGEVVMTGYQIFPGITLVYNDVHIGRCTTAHAELGNIIEINHCREGRIECEYQNTFFYLTQGDLSFSRKSDAGHASYFPLSHYHGITIVIDIDRAPKCLSCFLEDVKVSPADLMEKFCKSDTCFVARSKPCLEHIFSELYAVPEHIQKGYFKVKVLELLLFLSGMKVNEEQSVKQFFTEQQVALAKNICRYLSEHMDKRITISQLAELFHVSQTKIKSCFKGVYGIPLYTYIKEQKMQAAALMLWQSESSILEIAGRFGYDNGSKFAASFRTAMGMTPGEYRTMKRQEDKTYDD